MDKVDLSAYGKPAAPRVSPGGVALPQEKPSLTGPDLSSFGKPAGASFGKYAKEVAKGVGAGTGNMLGSIAKGAAIMQTVDPKELDAFEHQIKNIKQMPWEEANDFVQNMALKHLKALDVMPWVVPKYNMAARAFWKGDSDKGNRYLKEARAASETRPLDQQPLYKQGDEYQKEFADPNHALAPGKGWENSNTRIVSEAAGSMIPFFLAGPLGGGGEALGLAGRIATSLPRVATIAGVGGLAQTDQQHDMAQGALDKFNKEGGAFTMPGEKPSPFIGMTPEQAQALVMHESKVGFLPGMTEDAPIELLIDQTLGRIPWLRAARGSPMWTKFIKMAGRISLQVGAEGGQEMGQQYLANLIHQMNTDPNQPLSEGLLQNFLIGGLLGGGIQAGIEIAHPLIPGRRQPPPAPPPPGATPPGAQAPGVPPPSGPAGPAGPGAAGPQMPPMGTGAGMAPQPQIYPQGSPPPPPGTAPWTNLPTHQVAVPPVQTVSPAPSPMGATPPAAAPSAPVDLSKFGRPAVGTAPLAPPRGTIEPQPSAGIIQEPVQQGQPETTAGPSTPDTPTETPGALAEPGQSPPPAPAEQTGAPKPDLSGFGKPAITGPASDTTAGPSAPRGEVAPISEPAKSDQNLKEAAEGLNALFGDEPTPDKNGKNDKKTPSTDQAPSDEGATHGPQDQSGGGDRAQPQPDEATKTEPKPKAKAEPEPDAGTGGEKPGTQPAQAETTAGPTAPRGEAEKTKPNEKEKPTDVTTGGPSIGPTQGSQDEPTKPDETVKPEGKTRPDLEHFDKLGHDQRGDPEFAMNDVQKAAGGGLVSFLSEHVGDIIHRMSHMATFGMAFPEIVKEKTRKTLKVLQNSYGVQREIDGNARSNADFRGGSLADYWAKVDAALKVYADAHRALPTYNEPQRLAQEAAIAIGEKDWKKAEAALVKLDAMADNPEAFTKAALTDERVKTGDETKPQGETTKPKPKTKGTEAPAEKVENAGEELHGSRKEIWGARGINLKDYETMSGAERAELVTKPNVWPKPDYAKMVEGGVEPKAAYMIKSIYDGIPLAPIGSHARQEYILAIELLRAVADKVKTFADAQLFQDMLDREFTANKEWAAQLKGLDSEINSTFGILGFLAKKGSYRRSTSFSIYNLTNYRVQHRADKEIAKGWPNMEGWKRFFTVQKTTEKEKDGPVKDLWRLRNNGYATLSKHDTEAEAIKAAEAAYETMMSRRGSDGLPVRPRLDSIKRTGQDYRQGKNVTSDDFIKAFGFRGVRFGDWVDNTERQKIINLAYDALHDLASALGIPPEVIGLDGKIGLALGSHGRGGKGAAAAHYEPALTIVNLTKMNGAGSLAHEWAHALDHYLGELNTKDPYGDSPKSISGWQEPVQGPDKIPTANSLPPKARAAAKDLIQGLYYRTETNEEMRERLDGLIVHYRSGLADWIRSGKRKSTKQTREQIEIWGRKLAMYEAQRADPKERHRKKIETDYFKEAKKISGKGDYWIQGTEMFARAFEAYVFDTLTAKKLESQYLVHGNEETRFAQGYRGNPYPTGEERKRFNELFTKLLDALEPADGKKGISRLAGVAGEVEKTVTSDDSVPLDYPESPIDLPLDETPALVGPDAAPETSEPAPAIKSDDKVVEAFRTFFSNIENSFSTIVEARKFAETHGFKVEKGTTDNKLLQEKIELALVLTARDIVAANPDPAVAYKRLVGLYARQPNLGARTSESVTQQAYSTPVPLAFLAQNMAGVTQSTTVYEPTAGNGALIFMASPANVRANELNAERAKQLRGQGYVVSEKDATEAEPGEKVDVVIANPPFGTVRTGTGIKLFKVNGWETNQIDQAIALQALADMKADGKAVIIVGSVKEGESRPLAYNGAKRSFFWRLYQTYNVTDHFTISGDLYKKQGAGWPVDVIVIDGTGKSKMKLPSVETPTLYTSWEELNEKVKRNDDLSNASDTGTGPTSGKAAGVAEGGGPTGTDGGGQRPSPPVGPAAEPGQSDGLRNEPDRGSGLGAGEQQSAKPGGSEVGSGLGGEPAGSGKPPSDLELSSTFAGIIEQLKKEQAEKAAAAGPPRVEEPTQEAKTAATEHNMTRNATVASELTSAAKETLSGLDEAATGLFQLFNDPDKLGAGLSFDEETYAKAKPFFEKAWQHFKSAATDVASAMNLLMRHMMETMNWTIEKLVQLEPYITRFVKDKMAEGEAVALGESETQKPYKGQSTMPSLETLVPTNMRDVTTAAVERLREEKGNLDEFVSKELGYSLDEKSPDWMGNFLGGEQVDAIALAIDNAQKGKGFIIGDQTGIGKGRVIAGVIRYALKNKMSPIFVTHKPNLYGDIIRDLNDIEVPKMAGRKLRLFITNRGETIPLDLAALQWFEEAQEADAAGEKIPPKVGEFLKSPTPKQHADDEAAILKDGGVGLEKSFDIVFTTYNQMQTVKKGETDRRNLIRAIGPNSFILMDESHNAGGDEMKRPKVAGSAPDAATFLRGIAGQAKAVLFSSATYAKRPHTMGLYGRTDMGLAVEKISQLGGLIAQGGVPMQQIVASMLTKAGQYVRRERSFEGIRYDVVPVAIIPDAYNKFSRSVRDTFNFDVGLKDSDFWKDLLDSLKPEGAVVLADGSTGDGSASSTNFTSIMHNLVGQMLLSIKADSVAERAITAIKNGEKPVITVSGTMGAFIENAADTLDLTEGDKFNMSFKDVAKRYLRRVMRITIKTPQIDGPDKITYYQVEPDDLPPSLRQGYDDALESITAMVAEDMPLSPIDWIKFRIQEAGYNVGEITGRKHTMKYTGRAEATYQTRSDKEVGTAGRVSSINRFNNEIGTKELHALILNRAGSTGLSLHAGKKFKNQKPRAMIIAQAEGNIDEHMQLLGRINRTGQTVLPRYEQAYADIPAEARPAAILAKKMASLNANTTASRRGAFSGDEDVDFNNKYGDQIVYQMMLQNPDLQARTNIKLSKDGIPDNLLAKFTGKLTVFEIEEQEQILDTIKDQYKDLIAELDAAGENDLEAKTEDLRAKTIDSYELKSGTGPGPFQQAVNLETVEIKSAGRAYSVQVIIDAIETATSVKADPAIADDARRLANLAARAQAANQDTAKYWYNLWIEHGKSVMATFKNEETRRRHRTELVAEQKQWEWIFERVRPGSRVTLTVGENAPMTVITIEVDRRQKEKLTKGSNPLALGAWTVTFAMPDNSQRLIVPFSSIGGYSHGNKEKDEIEDKKRIKISNPSFYDNFEKLAKVYEAAAHEGKEIRHIVTGNILAAFDQVKARGQILNYTTEDGTVQPGVLMPRAWKKDTFLENRNVQFHSGRQILEFLKVIKQGASVLSRDLMISIDMLWNGFVKFSINKSKSKGGVYWDRPDVKDITGTMPESGGFFTYQTNDHFKVESLADALLNAGAILEVNKEQDTAKGVVDKFPTQSEAEAQMKGADDKRQSFAEFVQQNGTLVQADMVTKLQAMAQRILGHRVKLTIAGRIRRPDGSDTGFTGEYTKAEKDITLALFHAQDAINTLGHEAIHALRDLGVFTDDEWAVLVADATRDKEFMASLRRGYAHYKSQVSTEAAFEEAIEEEAVAYMMGAVIAEEESGARTYVAAIARKIIKFLKEVNNWLHGLGFTSVESITDEILSGRMKKRRGFTSGNRIEYMAAKNIRPPRNPAPGSFIEPFDERMETAWRDYNDTLMNRVGRVLTSGFKRGVHNFQDDKWDVKRAQNAIEAFNGVRLPETLDVYGGASLYPTRTAERLRLMLENYVKPLISEIAGRGLTIPQVNKFLIAMHVPERNDSIGTMYHPGDQYYEAMYNPSLVGGSGWSNDRAAQVITNAHADGSYASLMMIAKRVWAFNESNLRMLLREGLITQPIYDDLVIKWQYYVPLRGEENVIDYDNPDISWKGKGHDMRVKEFHQALGRTSGADSPLGYTLLQGRQGIEHVENNRVAKRLLRLATRYPNEAFWKINLIQMKRYQDKATGFVKYAYDRTVHLAPEDFAAKVHGQTYHITLYHEGFRDGMKNMGKNQMVGFVRALHKGMRLFTLVNTGLNPSFLFNNFERDLQTAAAYMQDSQLPSGLAAGVIKGVPAAVAAMNRYLRNDFAPNDQMALWAREFALAGGKMGYMDRFDINATNREVDSLMAEANPSVARRTWMVLRDQGIKRVERYNESIENGIRLSLYIALRAQGQAGATPAHVLANPIPQRTVPRDVSARASQEITINFSRKGKSTPTMNAFYPFFGASMQGIVGGLKFTARSPKIQKILIGIMLAGLLQDLLNRMMAGDDDDGKNRYDKIPWSIKQRYFIIMNSKSMQDAGYPPYTKIAPLGHYLSFFHNLGTILGSVTAGDMGIMPAVGNLVTSIQNNFVPFSGSDDIASMLMPTPGDPFLEILRNQDYFGQPIEPKVFDETIPHSERFKSNIAPWWREIAKDVNALTGGNQFQKGYIDLSPQWLEHLAGFASGGAGRFLSDLAQTVETMAHGELPESTKIPILKLFAGQPPIYNDRDAYFAIKDAVHVADRERDSYPTGSAQRDQFERSHQRELQMVVTLKIADRLIGHYRKQFDSTKQWPESPEKQAELKRLTDQVTEEMRKVRLQWNIPWKPAP